LIGLREALDMILTGRNLRAKRARRVGLVDQVVGQEALLKAARDAAAKLATGKLKPRTGPDDDLMRVLLEGNPIGRAIVFREARKTVMRKTKGLYPAPLVALDIIEKGLYARGFVEKWCFGIEPLKERAGQYPVDKVSEITWVPPEKIRQAAEWYARLTPGVTNHGMGIEHLANSIETLHAHFILSALCGNVDQKGGDIFTTPYPGVIHEQVVAAHERPSGDQISKTLGIDRFRLFSRIGYDFIQSHVQKVWGNEAFNRTSYEVFAHGPTIYRAALTGKPYPVRGIVTLSSNPMVTAPNTALVYKALKALDLYVVVDFFMTPSGQLADFVLPATTYLERPWLWTYSGIVGSERAIPKSVEGQYERRDDYDVWRGLGLELGQEADWPWPSLEDLYDFRLKPIGLTFEGFMKQGGFVSSPKVYHRYETEGFATPTGKIELYSKTLEALGYDPLPTYQEPHESPVNSPEVTKEYPLILTTGSRRLNFLHTQMRNISKLRDSDPEQPLAEINPEAARKYGIADGDMIRISTKRGSIKIMARVTEDILPQVVRIPHGWIESNCNVLTFARPADPVTGIPNYKAMLCRVEKAETKGRMAQ